MTYLLANGCSYTDPNYNKGNNHWHSDEDKKRLGIPLDNWPMWPEYVAKKLGLEYLNLATSGASNARMYRGSERQILEVEKPKVLMHLWTSGFRNDILSYSMNDHLFYLPIEIANHLLKRNEMMICDNAKRYAVSNYAGAFTLIKFYYSEEYEGVKDFYRTLYNETKNSQSHNEIHPLENILDHKEWWANRSGTLWFCEYYRDLYRTTGNLLEYRMKWRMDEELKPFYNTYKLCKKHNIPLITVCGLPLGGYIGYYYQPRDLDTKNPNYFEEALLGALKMCEWMSKNWTKNYWFNELEKHVFENNYVLYNWPLVRELLPPKQRFIQQWMKGFKNVSLIDQHPNWDSQKLIANLFYDLYKENYS